MGLYRHKWSLKQGLRLCIQIHMISLSDTSIYLAIATTEYSSCQEQRPTMSSHDSTIPWEIQPTVWWKFDYFGPLS